MRMRLLALTALYPGCTGQLVDEGTGDEHGTADLVAPSDDPLADDSIAKDADAVPIGGRMLVLKDLRLRKGPSTSYDVIVTMRRGQHAETIERTLPEDGWWKLDYDGKTGWASAAFLVYVAPDADRVQLGIDHPNAIFKRQVYHPTWNPTGPSTSGNCAPASLAMAARVLGKEPAWLTVEQSIDRIRDLMDKPSDSGGATRAMVQLGADRLDLKWIDMPDGDLDDQLDAGRIVVLEGMPGDDGTTTPTRYQRAFIDAGYSYTFDGRHSICVLGRSDDGGYVVADPLSKVGTITLTTTQIRDFYVRWGGTGTAVWR